MMLGECAGEASDVSAGSGRIQLAGRKKEKQALCLLQVRVPQFALIKTCTEVSAVPTAYYI